MCGLEVLKLRLVAMLCGRVMQPEQCGESVGDPIQKSSTVAEDFFSIFSYICDRLNDGGMELFAMIAHKIWLRRNRLVFGGSVQSPSCLLKGATEELDEFRKSLVDAVDPSNGGQNVSF